jgi:hypothetical protein
VDFTEVLPSSGPAQGGKPKTYVKKKRQVVVSDEQVEARTEMVIWTEDPAQTYSLTLCEECGRGDAAEQMLLCDKCDRGFHMFCLSPILVAIPPGDWICPHCSQSTIAHGMVSYVSFKCLRLMTWWSTVLSLHCNHVVVVAVTTFCEDGSRNSGLGRSCSGSLCVTLVSAAITVSISSTFTVSLFGVV